MSYRWKDGRPAVLKGLSIRCNLVGERAGVIL